MKRVNLKGVSGEKNYTYEENREGDEIILSKDVVFTDGYIQYLGKNNVILKNTNYEE